MVSAPDFESPRPRLKSGCRPALFCQYPLSPSTFVLVPLDKVYTSVRHCHQLAQWELATRERSLLHGSSVVHIGEVTCYLKVEWSSLPGRYWICTALSWHKCPKNAKRNPNTFLQANTGESCNWRRNGGLVHHDAFTRPLRYAQCLY